jgi:hypothetical protein
MDVTVRLDGLQAMLAKEKTVGAKTAGLLTEQLLKVGDLVAADVRERYQPYSAPGAAGVQEKVFTSGLWVVQTIRRTRSIPRRRDSFGSLMMRKAFGPAAIDNESRVLAAGEIAVNEARERYWDD